MSGPRHLVLGGSGFIGRHVAAALSARGRAVLVADRHEPAPPPGLPRLPHRRVDLADADLDTLLRDGDIVHHYAWSTIPKTANDDPLADLDANLRGTVRLLAAMTRRQGTRLLFASSGGTVYGPLSRTPVAEDHPLDPVTAYGVSKLAAEKYIGFFRASQGLDARIARISNPFGIGQDPTRKQGAASVFLQRALARETLEVWGDGSVVRDYIHIGDLAQGLIALAEAPLSMLDGAVPVFNLGSGEGVSLHRLIGVLGGLIGRRLDVRFLPSRAFDVPVNVLDVSRARGYLGWAPRLDLASGLELAISDHLAGQRAYSTWAPSWARADSRPASSLGRDRVYCPPDSQDHD